MTSYESIALMGERVHSFVWANYSPEFKAQLIRGMRRIVTEFDGISAAKAAKTAQRKSQRKEAQL